MENSQKTTRGAEMRSINYDKLLLVLVGPGSLLSLVGQKENPPSYSKPSCSEMPKGDVIPACPSQKLKGEEPRIGQEGRS